MKLKKGSAAAKAYMAKIRAKRGKSTKKVGKKAAPKKAVKKSASHKDTKSHNVNIKVVSGLSKSKKLQNALKKDGLKLPHGYNVAKRAKIGDANQAALSDYKTTLAKLKMYEKSFDSCHLMVAMKKQYGLTPQKTKEYQKSKNKFRSLISESKAHLRELKKHL
jgi:hypothetical protein